MHNYGEALQYQREVAGLSLMELGRQVGISYQNIGRWERGEVIPNIDFCVRLAAFYGISINELLGISEGSTTPIAAPMGDHYSPEERRLIEKYRKLSPDLKAMLNGIVGTWTGDSESFTAKKS